LPHVAVDDIDKDGSSYSEVTRMIPIVTGRKCGLCLSYYFGRKLRRGSVGIARVAEKLPTWVRSLLCLRISGKMRTVIHWRYSLAPHLAACFRESLMSDRTPLLEYWRSRLQASDADYLQSSPRLKWLRAAYIRVFRFLLSRYGPEEPAAATENPASGVESSFTAPEAFVSTMPMVDNTWNHRGRPPKAVGKIQSALKGIHNANDRTDELGPLAKGLSDDDWVVIAAQRDRWIPKACVKELRARGVVARTTRINNQTVVEVCRKDAPAALKILRRHKSTLKRNKHSRQVRTIAFMITAYLAVGLVSGLIAAGVIGLAADAVGGRTPSGRMLIAGGLVFGVCGGLWPIVILLMNARRR
jgi:hypothetical protein